MLFGCIFVPDFPAEAVARAEPELRGQAVVVVEGTPPLLTVIAANDRARSAGVEPGMTNVQAAARLAAIAHSRTASAVERGTVRRRSLHQEASAHAALADCARAFSPRVEECGADIVLLDLHGLERLFGPPQKIARELARRAGELGLEVNVAVAANLDAAICAAHGFVGVTVMPPEKETERLAPLSVEVLLQATAEIISSARAGELLETLDRWGIRTFRSLAALPSTAVSERLGYEGVYLQKLCRGEGTRALSPTETPLNFEEAVELECPVEDMEALAFVLNRLIEQLCARLSARALSTNELRLRMEFERLGEYEIGKHGSTRIKSKSAIQNLKLALPIPMLDAKTFLRLLQLELRAHPPAGPVAKMWLSAEPVRPRFTQGGLFLPTAPEPERLELTLARISAVLRENAAARQDAKSGAAPSSDDSMIRSSDTTLRVGSAEIVDSHRPGTFRMKRFAPPDADMPSHRDQSAVRNVQANHSRAATSSRGTTALRLCRPPAEIDIDIEDEHPVRMRGHSRAPDISGSISWCAGPWRTSGEWWNNPWSREEWDVAVETASGRVLCRIFRNTSANQWCLEGTYD